MNQQSIFNKQTYNTMKKKNPIEEARRYVDNAKKALRENGDLDTELSIYQDEKYVRAAGHYLWHSVLIALDSVFEVRKDRRTRVNIDDYLNAIRKRDKKLLVLVNNAYDVLHLYMGYDGNPNKTICDEGFHLSSDIIDRCEKMIA